MSVYYMVELDFPHPKERAGFDHFYDRHISMLLGIDGFRSAQRLHCVHEAVAPFLAIYELDDAGVLERPGYRARGGPSSVSEVYRPRMINWDRNIVEGPEQSLEVPVDGWLQLIDRRDDSSPGLPEGFHVFRTVGLDRSVIERGVRLGDGSPPPAPGAREGWVVRTFKPVHPMRRP